MPVLIVILAVTASLLLIPHPVFADIEKRLAQLEEEIEEIRARQAQPPRDSALSLYGSFRPVLTYNDDDEKTTTDIQDGLSYFGLRGSTDVLESTNVFFQGEWRINIADEGQFDGARLALAGMSGNYGKLTLGKQRPPHYLLVGEHIDIFNHNASPFGYNGTAFAHGDTTAGFDNFFMGNATMYEYQSNGLRLLAAVRTDGSRGENTADTFNAGVSWDAGIVYIAAAYVDSTGADKVNNDLVGDQVKIRALAFRTTISDLYIAVAHQNIAFKPPTGKDIDRSSMDVSLAYPLRRRFTVKTGYFDYDDGDKTDSSRSFSGINLTLEKQLMNNARIHLEYLYQGTESSDSMTQISAGLRYDFSSNFL